MPRAVFTQWMHELLDELESNDSDFKKVAKEIRQLVVEQAALRDIAEDMGELLQVREEVRGMGRADGGWCEPSAGGDGDDMDAD